jgi:type I restriction enzyme M protein
VLRTRKSNDTTAATLGYEVQLWQMADALRGSMDAAEYKHVCLGLLFLKYISDAFEEKHAALLAEKAQGADPEDPDQYRAQGIFWVPPEARWAHLKAQARQATVGQFVDDAMAGIERDNPALKGVLPKDYARPALDKQRLGQLIDMISNIKVGDEASRAKDVLGRVYEYFLSQFASAEGKKGGEFYTPRCVVKLLVETLEPYRGRVYDPCCGSSGMFVQSVEFIKAHAKGNGNGGKAKADISIYGQESNYTTWRLARMNLAIRGIDSGQIAQGDTFHNDRHPDLKADFILANPPFNISDWGGERLRDDKRWQYGTPPAGNANFAWVQHIVHHLAPAGVAGFVLANGSMSSNQSGEGEIRKALIEADLVDCMVALPGQLFYSTQIPACLWFLRRDKRSLPSPPGRGAGGEGTTPAPRANAPVPTRLLDFARQLRGQATDAEALLWRLLRDRQIANAKFRRQHPYPPYILDFYCHELKLAVELDGGQHNEEAGRRKDARRDECLAEHGIRVLRFWNGDVLRDTEAVLEAIYAAVVGHAGGVPSPPTPLPRGEGSFGLPQSRADLFPARLVDSELGEIPEGWEVKPIGDMAEVLGGSTPKTERAEYWEGGTHHRVTPKDLSGLSMPVLLDTERKIADAGLAQISSGLLPKGSVLLSSRAPIGYLAIAEIRVAVNQGFIAMKPRPGKSNLFLLRWASAAHDEIVSRANGSTFLEISKASFRPIRMVAPTAAVMQAFDRVSRPMYLKVVEHERESRSLAALRDTLLPKLISGELRVKDAERFLAGAT